MAMLPNNQNLTLNAQQGRCWQITVLLQCHPEAYQTLPLHFVTQHLVEPISGVLQTAPTASAAPSLFSVLLVFLPVIWHFPAQNKYKVNIIISIDYCFRIGYRCNQPPSWLIVHDTTHSQRSHWKMMPYGQTINLLDVMMFIMKPEHTWNQCSGFPFINTFPPWGSELQLKSSHKYNIHNACSI